MEAAVGVCIIAVGDELLEGRTVDTNSRRIQRALGGHAVRTRLVQSVPDQPDAIAAALDQTRAGELVFLCGGLGSTPDDLTREAVATWAGVAVCPDDQALEYVCERFRLRGRPLPSTAALQGRVPAGLKALPNPVGSAPGLVGRLRERWLAMLPGFPLEVDGLLPVVLAELDAKGVLPTARDILVRRCAQVTEMEVVRLCGPLRDAQPDLHWSWWVTDWGVDVRVAATDKAGGLGDLGEALDVALGPLVFNRGTQDLPLVVQERMLQAGHTCGVAESCTAGLIGGALTSHGGSSGFFRGGFLVYADEVKTGLLGVSPATLAVDGAVSEPVVRAMADGCRERLGCTHAIAVSGISGPGGGSPANPVGTTWMAVSSQDAGGPTTWAHAYRFPADRERNRLLTVAAALDTLRRVQEFGADRDPWLLPLAWPAGP
ncbi:hypothetical protein CO151_13215 [bacterium CG_4_9_14_3_um_filter_65_15]|nr:MAG: hypothetical protein CO151_13215 [bacterium CG_4_9_14_3_um_filter_65_15]